MTENTSGIEYTKINQQWSKQRFRYLFNKKWENKGNKGHAQNKQRRGWAVLTTKIKCENEWI